MKETKVLLIRETVWQSLAKDAGTFATVVSIIGLGRWLDSAAMQWFGFVMAAIFVMVQASTHETYTPQQAADWLARHCHVRAKEE